MYLYLGHIWCLIGVIERSVDCVYVHEAICCLDGFSSLFPSLLLFVSRLHIIHVNTQKKKREAFKQESIKSNLKMRWASSSFFVSNFRRPLFPNIFRRFWDTKRKSEYFHYWASVSSFATVKDTDCVKPRTNHQPRAFLTQKLKYAWPNEMYPAVIIPLSLKASWKPNNGIKTAALENGHVTYYRQ